jgi:hypothetical protein
MLARAFLVPGKGVNRPPHLKRVLASGLQTRLFNGGGHDWQF